MSSEEEKLRNIGRVGEQPLLVLKYEAWRILWKLLFPYSIAMPIFYMITFHWAPSRPASLMTILSQVLGMFILVGSIWLILDMFLLLACPLISSYAHQNKQLILVLWVPSSLRYQWLTIDLRLGKRYVCCEHCCVDRKGTRTGNSMGPFFDFHIGKMVFLG